MHAGKSSSEASIGEEIVPRNLIRVQKGYEVTPGPQNALSVDKESEDSVTVAPTDKLASLGRRYEVYLIVEDCLRKSNPIHSYRQ